MSCVSLCRVPDIGTHAPYGVTHTHFALASLRAVASKSNEINSLDVRAISSRGRKHLEFGFLRSKSSANELELGARGECKIEGMVAPSLDTPRNAEGCLVADDLE
jgi:hypothetical protein